MRTTTSVQSSVQWEQPQRTASGDEGNVVDLHEYRQRHTGESVSSVVQVAGTEVRIVSSGFGQTAGAQPQAMHGMQKMRGLCA